MPDDDFDGASRHPIERLRSIMAALRAPDTGCPWDVAQTFRTIAPYTIEEAYEVADAIEHDDMAHLKEELGDLLLQVIYHSRMAEEVGHFALDDVIEVICDKMVRRHPHVFGTDEERARGVVEGFWEDIKAREKVEQRANEGGGETRPGGALDGVPVALPALSRAFKLQKKAARIGFDWTDAEPVYGRVRDELDELYEAAAEGDLTAVAAEAGDLLFTAVNLVRHLKLDPETALRGANKRFAERFAEIEKALAADGLDIDEVGAARLEELWSAAKRKLEAPG